MWLYYDTEEKKTIVFKKHFPGYYDSYATEKRILEKLKGSNICPPLINCDDDNMVIQSEKGEISLSQYDDYIKQNAIQ